MKKTGLVAVVGAGLSGLSCAQALAAAGVGVRVFERGSVIGGRCATQLWQGHLVDTGVQFFTAQSGEFKRELLTRLRQFRPIVSPLFDADGKSIPNTLGPRFYVLQGNNYFAHILSQGLDVRLNTEIKSVTFRGNEAHLHGESYRAIVSAVPGPETARLFKLEKSPADFEPCLVALLEYGGKDLGRARECYGRVFPHGDPVLATYCENNKVGRIVGNKTVFVAEASPRFSADHLDQPSDCYLPALIKRHEEIWSIPSGQMTAASGLCWRIARPVTGGHHAVNPPEGGFICGDSRCDANVESVWLDGQKAAQEVMAYLSAQKK